MYKCPCLFSFRDIELLGWANSYYLDRQSYDVYLRISFLFFARQSANNECVSILRFVRISHNPKRKIKCYWF